MMISTFIIDDEKPARTDLRYLLEQLDTVKVVGEASSASEGLARLRELLPQLLFLDIQMPGLSGIELSRLLRELPDAPLVVFSTAYSRFAVDAFEVDAFDYLLKPYSLERLQRTINKAFKHLSQATAEAEKPALKNDHDEQELKLIAVQSGGKMHPIPPENILFVRCTDTVTHIHTLNKIYKTNYTITALFQQLAPLGFFRSHRNSIVNLKWIQEIQPWFNGNSRLIMNDESATEIMVSRRRTRELKKLFLAK